MSSNELNTPFLGFDAEQLKNLTANLNGEQLLWLSGYFYGLNVGRQSGTDSQIRSPQSGEHLNGNGNGKPETITILYGSQTGNSKSVANKVAEKAKAKGLQVVVADMNDYAAKNLKNEKRLLIVVSTQGEGDPPVSAEEFREFLLGTRAPKLPELQFSVLALGDKSYLNFCQTGREFDERLEALGAKRMAPRMDCDVDFQDDADAWAESVLAKIAFAVPSSNGNAHAQTATMSTNGFTTVTRPAPAPVVYDRKNPFEAEILEKIQLNGKGAFKETYHVELSLENSGLAFEPGDSLSIYPSNPERLVFEVLHHAKLDASTIVDTSNGQTLIQALLHQYELTVVTIDVLKRHNEHAHNTALTALLADNGKLKDYLWGRDVVDMLKDFPAEYTVETFIKTLRKLPPRAYSIASSLKAYPDEVHLTVAAVRYKAQGRYKEGSASTHIADRLKKGDLAKVFLDRNEFFKLPTDPNANIIMVGPGTGIAPFRAFTQDREATGANGKNWLFFGNPHFTTDFLYQTEWLQYLKKGVLTHLDVAFSRDTPEKVYVQHKLLNQSKEVFDWLESGAYFYVCGDKNKMASDVQNALTQIVEQTGGLSKERAQEYIKNLKKQRRYLEDVY